MLIENSDALKAWLTANLEPLCDADPAALSKYVLALIKKDKPLDDLKESMAQQMDVFLQGETKGFVDSLFVALESKEYLNVKDSIASADRPVTDDTKDENQEKENEGPIKNEQLDSEISGKPDSTTTPAANEQAADGRRPSAGKDGRRFREDDRSYRGRRSGTSPPPIRDRSPPSRRRYRRPISPPHGGPPINMGNRRFRSRSPPPRGSRQRGRSPDRYGRARSRSISPDRIRRRSFSRSRSRSPGYHRSGTHISPDAPGYVPSSKAPRCRDYDEKGFCMKGDQCNFDHGNDAVILEDSVGGVPAYNPTAPSTAPATLDTSIPPPPAIHSVPPPSLTDPYVPAPSVIIDPNMPPPVSGEPMPPLHLPPPGFSAPVHVPPPHFGGMGGQKRPFDGGGVDSNAGGPGYGPPPKRGFDFSRLGRGSRGGPRGGRGGFVGRGGSTAQLAVRNIPPSLNNIGLLNNHFGKFGTLVNVQVHFEGDPASALISYSNSAEAEAAINAPEAVLANRFIKVFYHQPSPTNVRDRLGVPLGATGGKVEITGDTLTKTIVNQEAAHVISSLETQAKDEAKTAEKASAIAAIRKNQEVLEAKAQMKKVAHTKQIEAAKRIMELRKGKQELLDKQLAEQKKLIAKVETKKQSGEQVKPEERAIIMKLIKTLSESIVKTKDELQAMVQASTTKLSAPELQKQLLDAELELFTAQAEGSDTSEIQKRVNALTVECARQGILPTSRSPGARGGGVSGSFRGRGGYIPGIGRGSRGYYGRGRGYRGRGGRGAAHFQTSVDRRPAKIKVGGFEPDDKEAIIAQFRRFGDVVETFDEDLSEVETEMVSVVIHYRTRREAEVAMIQGKTFGEQPLQLSWFTGTTPVELQSQLSTEETGGGSLSEVGSDILLADPDDDYTPLDPAYLPPGLEDEGKCGKELGEPSKLDLDENLLEEEEEPDEDEEEEDEEDGERSWKR